MATVPTGVLEAAVYVEDLDAAESFYGGVLGLEKLLRVDGRHVFFRCGTTVLLCFVAAATKVGPPANALPVPTHGAKGEGHVCFSVNGENLDELVAMLTSHGIEIEADFRWPNGARSVYVRDPDGNSVEFAEPKLWGYKT
ncbi:MAG: VOC family protein [Dinoroseobacter sp.]|nr:VOC family protein [Dinoroseobacter sp.]